MNLKSHPARTLTIAAAVTIAALPLTGCATNRSWQAPARVALAEDVPTLRTTWHTERENLTTTVRQACGDRALARWEPTIALHDQDAETIALDLETAMRAYVDLRRRPGTTLRKVTDGVPEDPPPADVIHDAHADLGLLIYDQRQAVATFTRSAACLEGTG